MKRKLPTFKLTGIITFFIILFLCSSMIYRYITQQWIQTEAEEIYHYSQTLPKTLTKQIQSPYGLQQIKNNTIIYQTTPAMKLNNTKEMRIAKQNKRYGYQVRRVKDTPYLFVACQAKDSLLELYKPLHWLQTLQTFAHLAMIGLFLIFILTLSYFAIRYYRWQHEWQNITHMIHKIAENPSEPHTLFTTRKSLEPLATELNQLSQNISEQTISITDNQQHFQSLIQHLPVGLFVIDQQQDIVLMNDHARLLLNYKKEIPVSYFEVIQQANMLLYIKKALSTHHAIKEELTLHHFNDNEYTLELSGRYLTMQEEDYFIVTLYDVTELRRLELMQQTFVSNVSHELKTPITSIIGFIETLLDGALEDETTARTFLEIMQNDAARLQQLIQEIILLSRSGSELTQTEYVPINPQTMITQLLTHYDTMIKQKSLTVTIECQKPIEIITAPYYFEPIIKNLIENAIMYNKDNGQLTIHLTQHHSCAIITIQDTGIGMTSTELERIFERFYRVDKARSRNLGGTGLGLAIVKHYSAIIGASIDVQSQLGVGSTFTLKIPLNK